MGMTCLTHPRVSILRQSRRLYEWGPSKEPKRPRTPTTSRTWAPRPRSGKTMARTGLRMMPTSPWSPLKFRTAGFPRYGLKAGISDEAFTCFPGFVFVLRAGYRHRCFPVLCQGRCGQRSTSLRAVIRSTPGVLAPAGLCCPGHILWPSTGGKRLGIPVILTLRSWWGGVFEA
jgi:hypothetical protein